MENLLKISEDLQGYKELVGQAAPVVAITHDMFKKEVFGDASLSGRMKRLIGVAVAVESGSFSCLVNQTKQAVGLGATKDEVMEAVSVAIAMGGTGTLQYGGLVVKVLQELGKW